MCLPTEDLDLEDDIQPFITTIPKETTEIAVNLTEYFQAQRKIYENVSVTE
jgi:hypothetical protein